MSKWYMTLGCKGGEFACQDEAQLRREVDAGNLRELAECKELAELTGTSVSNHPVGLRPCPPDLAAWLDNDLRIWPMGEWVKAPGGWLISNGHRADRAEPCFIPVRGADGITILEVQHG